MIPELEIGTSDDGVSLRCRWDRPDCAGEARDLSEPVPAPTRGAWTGRDAEARLMGGISRLRGPEPDLRDADESPRSRSLLERTGLGWVCRVPVS